ncbi:hypothetical protein SAMN04487770_10245 [Butyrivibrio sp. ob235]|uniref:hypothetical protein n=1 Tax=Butyrivibrio sp. ob235 TaxID=1761780 RepID=UPI0008C0BEA2|nr:hypothetical protein [Butyrivibrio sp. ob235]SEK59474.1 hypothetical protein SAMN04487770_10245 [Butyrivibrio sp. ob235]
MTREEYIKNAFEAYDKHEYDSALQSFIAAHELSDLEGKKYIVEALYASFVEPNLDAYADQEVEETTDAILFDSICDFRDIWPEEFINYLKRTGNPVPKTIRSEFGFDYEELFKTLKTE